jgi:hypothetical protein
METRYKFMTNDRRGPYSGVEYPRGTLPALPGEPVPCKHGWHASRRTTLTDWLDWRIAEVQAESWLDAGNKCVTTGEVTILREGTLDVVAFAQACAERVARSAAAAAEAAASSKFAGFAAKYARFAAAAAEATASSKYAAAAALAAASSSKFAAADAADAASSMYAAAADARNAEREWQAAWILEHVVWE